MIVNKSSYNTLYSALYNSYAISIVLYCIAIIGSLITYAILSVSSPESSLYHIYALSYARKLAMSPIFSVTPLYALYLAFCYMLGGKTLALFVQIALCAFIPLIAKKLIYILTQSQVISICIALILCFCPSIIFSTITLTPQGFSILTLLLFLDVFSNQKALSNTYLAGIILTLHAWLTPWGHITVLVLLGFLVSISKWAKNFRAIVIITSIVSVSMIPWIIRNYQLTCHYFFCPVIGPAITYTSVSSIVSQVGVIPLSTSLRYLKRAVTQAVLQGEAQARISGKTIASLPEQAALAVGLPWVTQYPFLFIYYWLVACFSQVFVLAEYSFVKLFTLFLLIISWLAIVGALFFGFYKKSTLLAPCLASLLATFLLLASGDKSIELSVYILSYMLGLQVWLCLYYYSYSIFRLYLK